MARTAIPPEFLAELLGMPESELDERFQACCQEYELAFADPSRAHELEQLGMMLHAILDAGQQRSRPWVETYNGKYASSWRNG